MRLVISVVAALLVGQTAFAQVAPNPLELPSEPATQQAPQGKVLFSTDHPPTEEPSSISSSVTSPTPGPPDSLPKIAVTDTERSSIAIDSYDLDLHLIPSEAREETHATLVIRNMSETALSRFPLQISSTLRWQSISFVANTGLQTSAFTQSPIATDTDHTGYSQEAIIALDKPLAPGATLTLSAFYTGDIKQTAARLELLGTPTDRADAADWDEIAPAADDSGTALRGFGDVLWYPIAAPVAALGDGNKFFELIAHDRVQHRLTKMHLHLTVEYVGDPPVGAILNGQLQTLAATADDQDQLIAAVHGLATADFPDHPIGFRIPSLFLTSQQPAVTDGQLLTVITPNSEVVLPYAEAAAKVQPLLAEWFGPTPLKPLTLLDHLGEPFGEHTLLVGKLSAAAKPDDIAPELISGLSHAWFRSSQPWISEGIAQFMSLLWTERTHGRQMAIVELAHEANLLALAEPDLSTTGADAAKSTGQPLTSASSDIYLRSKSAAVFWQLRDILGEDVLKQGLAAYRRSESLNPTFDADPIALQKTLEKTSNKELGWFFNDWVYRDRSLPDLSIVQVSPHLLPARPGKNSGYLVAVEVRNDGDAIADVPVTVHSGRLTATERLRIGPHGTASTRILLEGAPDTAQLNDGGTPELRASLHTQAIETASQ